MNLTFTVTVEVSDRVGEQAVAYIKGLLSSTFPRNGMIRNICDVRAITYEEWMTKKDRYFETIEQTADKYGEVSL